jgi:hypothetical protein
LTTNGQGYIVVNVFSRGSVFTGDAFLGQAIVDMKLYPEIYKEVRVTLTVPMKPADFPIFAEDGKPIKVSDVKPQGQISLSFEVPSVYSNMCGWFTSMTKTFFSDIDGENVWVVLYLGEILCYDTPFQGVLRRKFSCKKIVNIEEIMFDKLEIPVEALRLTLSPPEDGSSKEEEEIIWGWKKDGGKYKGMWRRALKVFAPPLSTITAINNNSEHDDD